MDAGSASNAPSGTFIQHNFTGYKDYRFGSLLVTNSSGITGGRDQEDDDSYRSRIRLKLLSTSSANEDFLRSLILPIPGIQDVVFDRQAGTFYCYVYAISPLASASLLATVQQTLNDNVAYPATGTALNPDLIGISLETTIELKSGSTATDQQMAITAATTAVQHYINNLGIGRPLIINEIADQILNSSPLIIDVGQPNQPLNAIYDKGSERGYRSATRMVFFRNQVLSGSQPPNFAPAATRRIYFAFFGRLQEGATFANRSR